MVWKMKQGVNFFTANLCLILSCGGNCAAIPGAGSVKHRIDLVDDESKTLAYTVLGGDPSYSSFAAEMKFSPADDNTTEVIWTAKYEPVGEAGPPEHIKKNVIVTLKTFEKAVMENRVVRHTQTLNAPADTIWNILMHEDVILPKVIPHIIASYEFLEGNGEPGSIRLLKLGHGMHVASILCRKECLIDCCCNPESCL